MIVCFDVLNLENSVSESYSRAETENWRVSEPRFSLVTDGACDVLWNDGLETVGVPVHLAFGLEQYDSPGITNTDLYANLRSHAQHPTTSQPSPE